MKHIIRTFIFFTIVSFANINISLSQVLSADEFEKKYSESTGAQLIDVRTAGEYGGGHLPKATNVDYRSADFQEKVNALDKTKPVFVYCLSGGRSAAAAEALRKNGFSQVYDLQGGYLKWTTKMKPVEGTSAAKDSKAITEAELETLLAQHSIVILDFFAPWCGPCIKMMPAVEKLSEEYKGKVLILKVDADANRAILTKYHIDEIPTFLIFKDGTQKMRAIGYQEESALKKLFTQYL